MKNRGGTRQGVPVMIQTGRSKAKCVNNEKSEWNTAGGVGYDTNRLE